MAIGIPQTLTADISEKFKVSIRLRSDGLSFSGYMPSGHGSFFFCDEEFSRPTPYISSLKDVFFAHDFFSWSYSSVDIVNESAEYTIVPESFFKEEEASQLLRLAFLTPHNRCLHNALMNFPAQVVFGMDEEIYEFCMRSFAQPRFFQHITPLLYLWKQQNMKSTQAEMFVSFHNRLIDIVCFCQGELLFANSYTVNQSEDALYYILCVWKKTHLDPEEDLLRIGGDSSFREKTFVSLRPFVRHILPLEIPSEAFILRGDVVKAPLDLISLSVCEL